jgi:hypothetical protein
MSLAEFSSNHERVPMPRAPVDDVKKILEDFELRMREVLEGAWDEWLEMPKRGVLSPRSRASVVFDFIKQRALAEFDGDPNILALPKGQTVKFLFKDRVLVRFKKANASGIGSNIETQAVIEFVDPQLVIPGLLPDIYRIEVCYHLDKFATRMDTLAVTARDRNRKDWSYELRRPVDAGTGVIAFPAPTGEGPTPPEVRIKKPDEKPETHGE